tara:strand:- start:2426 stop:2911 length:486 start_codon:yes stop_codon:yes gene_type:complete
LKLAVLSDTHNNLKNVAQIVDIFNSYGVDKVIHTGDITQAKTLHALAGLNAPLIGVYGNNDVERDSLSDAVQTLDFHFQDPPLEFEELKKTIIVVHDPRDLDLHMTNEHSLALHGHTHLRRIEQEGGRLIFNPGECAGHMKGMNAVGIIDLETLEVDLIKF